MYVNNNEYIHTYFLFSRTMATYDHYVNRQTNSLCCANDSASESCSRYSPPHNRDMFIFTTHTHYLSVRSITHCWTLQYFKKLTKCTRRDRYTQQLKIPYTNESFSMLKKQILKLIPNIRHFLFRTSVFFIPNTWSTFVPNIRTKDFMLYRPIPNIRLFVTMSGRAGTKKDRAAIFSRITGTK